MSSEPSKPGELEVDTQEPTIIILTSEVGEGINSSLDMMVSPSLDESSVSKVRQDNKYRITLENLTPGTMYTVTIWAESGSEKSEEVSLSVYTSKHSILLPLYIDVDCVQFNCPVKLC